jgi:propanol-preferring alcohol dehydrogenase
METMQAAVAHAFREPLQIEEVERPTPGADQVLVQILASGVCHSDVHAVDGDWPFKPKLPLIPGHEGVGIVVARGKNVAHIAEGDRVGIPWLHTACGLCDYCLTGRETLCRRQLQTGYTVNGCFAEYTLAPASHVALIPKELDSAKAAPLLCAGVTTYKGLKQTEVRPGQWVVISGIGGLGHLAIQYAKAMGMHVAAVDVTEEKLALARRLGAEFAVNAATENAPKSIQREIGGAHGVLVTAVVPAAFSAAIGMLRPGATCVLLGLPPGEFPLPITSIVGGGLTIRGSNVGTRYDLKEALAIAATGVIDADIEYQPLDAVNATLDRLRHGTVEGRVILDFAHAHQAGSHNASHTHA